jgi:Ca2+-binding EF-hand superfamily protein
MTIRSSRVVLATYAMGAAFAAAACSGIPSDAELVQGMAAAALVTSEDERGVIAEGARGAMTDADLAEGAAEATDAEAAVDPAAQSAGLDACDFSARRRRILSAYDANHNGRLDPTEVEALRADLGDRVPSRMGPMFGRMMHFVRHHAFRRVKWAFDVDNDGRLDAEERAVLVDALEQRCRVIRARLLAEFDANGNGTLDPEELQAARAAMRERLAARRAQILARYDANGNGTLDPEEREALRADLVARARERREALKARFDADGNGVLDPEEIAALKAYIREHIAGANEEA